MALNYSPPKAFATRGGQHPVAVIVVNKNHNGERQRFTFFWWTKHETAQAMIEAIVNGMLDQVYPECR